MNRESNKNWNKNSIFCECCFLWELYKRMNGTCHFVKFSDLSKSNKNNNISSICLEMSIITQYLTD